MPLQPHEPGPRLWFARTQPEVQHGQNRPLTALAKRLKAGDIDIRDATRQFVQSVKDRMGEGLERGADDGGGESGEAGEGEAGRAAMSKRRAPEEWIGCICPPGPFAPLSVQREFLMSLEDIPDCGVVRELRDETIEYIRLMEEHPGLREPNDLN